MSPRRTFDVIVVGGGIAGSSLAGVLARAGLGVLVVEKEERFRDRIRGEGTWPWGVREARQAGLDGLLEQAGVVEIRGVSRYEEKRPVEKPWEVDPLAEAPEIGFQHTSFQEAAYTWAGDQGAATIRPAKAVRFSRNGAPSVTVAADASETEYTARLIVGADGKHSMARRWAGGESQADPENHRMGGVLISGATIERMWDNVSWVPGEAVNWFAAGAEMTRLYLVMSAARLRETGVDRSFAAILDYASSHMPEGALEHARQEGPIGYFPNNDTWASCISGNGVVLVGDAAGSPDPTQGHGTSLLFHDVRALSELLLSETDWEHACAAFAEQRRQVFQIINAFDCWNNVFFDTSDEAARLREGHERARENDPTLMGFASTEVNGPYGLVADDAARRMFFGLELDA